ncbi:hypothetical protein ACIRPT_40210, partial [Streptomyces sp. NPDC101227]|uniref:hypothetical protein n=1 Tax=Streptomyces sp. NPDC101227 TaxID=3366136 RepID=UPI00381C37C2
MTDHWLNGFPEDTVWDEGGLEMDLGSVSATALSLRWVPPEPLTAEQRRAVAEIRTFRGMAWYDPDTRPWFRTDAGAFHDPGEPPLNDLASWHCLARDRSGHLTGCARVTPVGGAGGGSRGGRARRRRRRAPPPA